MAEQRRRVFESVTAGVKDGILTRNEAREQLGYEPIDGADSLLVPANLMPLNVATEETTEEDRGEDIPEEEIPEELQDDIEIITNEDDIDELIKAESDIDTVPTDGMVSEAKRGLEWRKEFNRGGTIIGVTRANQILNKTKLSPSTVRRMFSFFSRHESDKTGQGFDRGEDGYPSAGRIAWALWGGDAGFSWSRQKVKQLDRERDKFYEAVSELKEDFIEDEKQLTAAVKKGLQNKVDKHNEKHGDKKGKRVTLRMLGAVFRRGIGAYRTNPGSVRPSVRSEEQWAYARVNAFLYAVRTGRFRGGKFDLDLLPSGHPLKT